MNSHAAVTHTQVPGDAGTLRGTGQAIAVPGPGRAVAGYALIGAMILGSVSLFTLVPVVCLWVASMLTSSHVLGIVLALVSVPLAMVVVGTQLVRLDGLYYRVTGKSAGARKAPAYRRGVTDTNHPHEATMLERVMIASVALSALVYLVWFFFFAGSSLPA